MGLLYVDLTQNNFLDSWTAFRVGDGTPWAFCNECEIVPGIDIVLRSIKIRFKKSKHAAHYWTGLRSPGVQFSLRHFKVSVSQHRQYIVQWPLLHMSSLKKNADIQETGVNKEEELLG